ncbi:hypothetical protein ACQ86N_06065 [Puia sp. P3]|uniref:hypothetical protein n=1 Tax=Puia sp. P3 TaxID=3423952 RepID=UPI003D672D5A
MSTLINGPGLGTAFHEWMHSWYQGMMGTNESMYPWMDEGFTSYAAARVNSFYYHERLRLHPNDAGLQQVIEREKEELPLYHASAYNAYFALVRSGLEEPMTTHADHFNTNFAYSIASYGKGRCSSNSWAIS